MNDAKKIEQKTQKSSVITKCLIKAVLTVSALLIAWGVYVLKKPGFDKQQKTAVVITLPEEKSAFAQTEKAPSQEIFEDEIEKMGESPVMVENQPKIEAEKKEIFKDEILSVENKTEEKTPAKAVSEAQQPMIAIVIDDAGASTKRTEEVIGIDAPITLAFLPDSEHLAELLSNALSTQHEVIVHVPMQPRVQASLESDTLKVDMSDDELKEHFLRMLSVFDGFEIKGINNHMGSLFTESAPKLDVVAKILKEKGLYFLDSKTTQHSQVEAVAALDDVDVIARDVFLDNKNDYDSVLKQLKKAEKIARQRGSAVVIGHPKSETIRALKDWIQSFENKDIKLVYLSKLVKLKNKKN